MLVLALFYNSIYGISVFNVCFSAVLGLYLFSIYYDENGRSNFNCYVETSLVNKIKSPITLLISDPSVALKKLVLLFRDFP